MKYRKVLNLLLVWSFYASANEEYSVCSSLLDHGIANVITQTSELDYLSVIRDDYCSYSYATLSKNKQNSFEATVKKIPVGLKGSSSKTASQHEEFCRNYEAINSQSTDLRYKSRQLYSKAIDAWSECVDLALGGTRVKGIIDHNQETVDFSMSQVKGESIFKGVDTHNMTCVMNDKPISGDENVLLNSNNQSIRCSRIYEKIVFNTSEVKYYPPANVKVKTTTGDYRIELFEAVSQPMNDRLARIEAMLTGHQVAIDKTDAVVASIGQSKMNKTFTINGPRIGGADKMTCPQGWMAISVHASGSVGGKYAVDGISQIKVTCSPIYDK